MTSVLNQVNNKVTSGEISLNSHDKNHHNNGGEASPRRSCGNNSAIESAGSQASNITELEDALKSISERIERILSPTNGSMETKKEELLGEIKNQLKAESARALSKVSEMDEKIQSEHPKITSKQGTSSQNNLRSSSSPSRPSLQQDQEQFNFEEIIRKKTGLCELTYLN